MTKIERRKTSVKLYPGNYASKLEALLEQLNAAVIAEESAPKRAGTRSKAVALAREHDALLAEAEDAAVAVEVHEISNIAWQQLADQHPPVDGNERDQQAGMNMKTFPPALLRASIGDPSLDLDELSRAHFVKLENAAWNLHNGDDALGKFSAVSLLKQARDPDSKLHNDSE